jgi:hypothetical protein
VEALVIPNKLMVAAIWTSKWLAFAWFIAFARADARGSGLIFKGWWHDHDWFHLLAICTAGLQLAAAATYA